MSKKIYIFIFKDETYTKRDFGQDGFEIICPFRLLHLHQGSLAKQTCGTRGQGSIPGLAGPISEIGYLLLQSREMAEMPL